MISLQKVDSILFPEGSVELNRFFLCSDNFGIRIKIYLNLNLQAFFKFIEGPIFCSEQSFRILSLCDFDFLKYFF